MDVGDQLTADDINDRKTKPRWQPKTKVEEDLLKTFQVF